MCLLGIGGDRLRLRALPSLPDLSVQIYDPNDFLSSYTVVRFVAKLWYTYAAHSDNPDVYKNTQLAGYRLVNCHFSLLVISDFATYIPKS